MRRASKTYSHVSRSGEASVPGLTCASYASFASSERRAAKTRPAAFYDFHNALYEDVMAERKLRSFTGSNPVKDSRVG